MAKMETTSATMPIKLKPVRVFLLFTLLNILNYLDRNVTSGILPLLKDHFLASDAILGSLSSAFMITYSLTALPFGAWSDRWQPHKVAAIGGAVWSVSTILSAFAWSVSSLFVFRALVGIGEAAFVVTGSTILSGLYPKDRRSRILGLFNLGMPIGGAAGVMLGGALGSQFGWQAAFVLVGFPGLLLAYFTWKLPIEAKTADTPGSSAAKFRLRDVGSLLHNVPYIFACLGYAGISFAFGALVWFAPTFFARDFGYGLDQAGFVAGAIQVGAGLLGAPFGGFAGDYWQRRSPRGRAYTLVLSMFLSGILLYVGLELSSIVCFFFSTFFMLWHVGVASALVFDVTSRHIWNTGQSLAMFLMHLLGDIPSTAIVGYVSDRTGLKTALSLLPIPMFLAALFFLLAGLYLRTKAVSANDRLIS